MRPLIASDLEGKTVKKFRQIGESTIVLTLGAGTLGDPNRTIELNMFGAHTDGVMHAKPEHPRNGCTMTEASVINNIIHDDDDFDSLMHRVAYLGDNHAIWLLARLVILHGDENALRGLESIKRCGASGSLWEQRRQLADNLIALCPTLR